MRQPKSNSYPLVTIIIPTRNRKKLLLQAIRSVLNQTYPNIKLVVHDNNSSDGSYDYINNKIVDPRLEYYRINTDVSMLENWTMAVSYVDGSYFMRLDDDNILFNNFIEYAMNKIMKYKLDLFILSPLIFDTNRKIYKYFDSNDNVYRLKKFNIVNFEFNCISDSNNAVYRVDYLKKILKFPNDCYKTTLPDRFLHYRIAAQDKNAKARVGFSTKNLGVTRLDYRLKQKAGSKFSGRTYINFPENADFVNSLDCHSNFCMHRAYTAYLFLNNCNDYDLKDFFEKKLLSSSLMRSYAIFGHLNEFSQVFSWEELIDYNKMIFILLFDLLKHPFLTFDRRPTYIITLILVIRFIKFNLLSLKNIFFRSKFQEEKLFIQYGDKICDDIIAGAFNFDSFHEIPSRRNSFLNKLKLDFF